MGKRLSEVCRVDKVPSGTYPPAVEDTPRPSPQSSPAGGRGGKREKRLLFLASLSTLRHLWRKLWNIIRQLSGDDGYERYLAHHAAAHRDALPLSRSAWFAHRQQQKWSGIKRCC